MMLSTRCPYCRSVDFRGVGVRNAVESALHWILLRCARHRSSAVPFAVGAHITGAYWFTSSTSFANPAVTLARAASDTFAGIRPADAPGFIVAQLAGAMAATLLSGGWCHRFRRMLLTSSLLTLKKKLLMPVKNRILILCTGNSARGQMAESLLRHDAGERFEVFSAGTKPSHGPRPSPSCASWASTFPATVPSAWMNSPASNSIKY